MANKLVPYVTFLKTYNDQFMEIVNNKETDKLYSVYVDISLLAQQHNDLYKLLQRDAEKEFLKWNTAAIALEKELLTLSQAEPTLKESVIVRFINNPYTMESFPTLNDLNCFVQVEGIVHSYTKRMFVEHAQVFVCNKCARNLIVNGDYYTHYKIKAPNMCTEGQCKGQMCPDTTASFKFAHTAQDIFLVEADSNSKRRKYLISTVEDDLVDFAKLGETVVIVGNVKIRQKSTNVRKLAPLTLNIKVNSIRRKENSMFSLSETERFEVTDMWQKLLNEKGEFGARDFLIGSFCPDLTCMYLPKLAVLLSIASCVEGEPTRPHSHILLVGDPGLAKSKLLERAAELSSKGFVTGGYRVSSAGLTAGILKTGGGDVYEAGVLPLCDNGICCIDEFNLMSEEDKGAMHEAMEQQTVSVTKAGVIAKLRSRCVIIAASNPRSIRKFMGDRDDSHINFGIQPALLSRFDIIFVMRDDCFQDWDRKVTRHIMDVECGVRSFDEWWKHEHLKKHLIVAGGQKPELTDDATAILVAYYQKLTSTTSLDRNRTTARALDGLFRIAKAYARLLLKPKVVALDAVVVIRLLLENSYGMGATVTTVFDPVRKDLPLGPTVGDVNEILRAIGLSKLSPEVLQQLKQAYDVNGIITYNTQAFSEETGREKPPIEISTWSSLMETNMKTQPLFPSITGTVIKNSSSFSKRQRPIPPVNLSKFVNEDFVNQPSTSRHHSNLPYTKAMPNKRSHTALEEDALLAEILGHNPKDRKKISKTSQLDPSYDMDDSCLLAEILGESKCNNKENKNTKNDIDYEALENEVMAMLEEQEIPPVQEAPILNASASGSSISQTLQRLHDQFSFSQVKKRSNKTTNERELKKEEQSSPKFKKPAPKKKKGPNEVAVPLDNINSSEFGGILNSVAAMFRVENKPIEKEKEPNQTKPLMDLVGESFFDDD